MIIPKSAIEELLVESKEDAATEGITSVANTALASTKKVANAVGTIGKAVIAVKGTIGKSSITRLGEDSILQFPAVFSANIDKDEAIAIAKMFEKYYASLLVSIFSLRPSIALNEYENIAEYIKSIHSNNAIPSNLRKAQHFAKESFTEMDDEFCLVEDEPSGLCVDGHTYEDPVSGKKLAMECWGVYGGQLDMNTLNSKELPYVRTQKLVEERLNMAKAQKATEGLDEVQSNAMSVVNVGNNSSTMLNANFSEKGLKSNGKADIKNDINMLPTMIDVTFYLHGSKSGDAKSGASFTQQVTLGVKSMVRTVSSEYMITNLVEGSKTSNPIFKLISWTRGEYKLVKDMIFHIGEIKKKFKDKKNDTYGFLDMSKDRKNVDDVSKFAGNRILPYLTLVVTETEALTASSITGVDLSNARNAKAFMDKYYLLTFAIYNPNTKQLQVMHDGDSEWETMSMYYIQSQAKTQNDISKMLSNMVSVR